MVNLATQFEQWTDLAFDRFVAKVAKADGDTAILIYVDTWHALPIDSRCSLLRRTKQYLIDKRPHIYGVYFCYGSDYEIEGILTAQALHRAA